ncbi:MAG: HemK family protein methyltransferase [Planctomycetota bacterium]
MTDRDSLPASANAAPSAVWSVRDCLAWTAQHFAAKEIPNPRVDAEELLAHAFELPRLQLLLKMDQPVPPTVRETFRGYVQRRAKREPLQHILGCVDFFGLRIETGPGVLIPRPETEGLVELAVTFLRERHPVAKPPLPVLREDPPAAGRDEHADPAPLPQPAAEPEGARVAEHPSADSAPAPVPAADLPTALAGVVRAAPLRVWDIGTGSGCIALAIARMHPNVQILASDIAPAALALAKRNAQRLNLAARVAFRRADLDQGLQFTAPFDLIVANPPYVPAGEAATIQPEVRHDPPEALYAGPAGLDVIVRILAMARDRLSADGALMLEIGHDQGSAAAAEADRIGFPNVLVLKDLYGKDRYLCARVQAVAAG